MPSPLDSLTAIFTKLTKNMDTLAHGPISPDAPVGQDSIAKTLEDTLKNIATNKDVVGWTFTREGWRDAPQYFPHDFTSARTGHELMEFTAAQTSILEELHAFLQEHNAFDAAYGEILVNICTGKKGAKLYVGLHEKTRLGRHMGYTPKSAAEMLLNALDFLKKFQFQHNTAFQTYKIDGYRTHARSAQDAIILHMTQQHPNELEDVLNGVLPPNCTEIHVVLPVQAETLLASALATRT